MSCGKAAPTAVPAMRPDMRSTVMAVGSTSVGEHNGIGRRDACIARPQPHPTRPPPPLHPVL